MRWCGRDLRRLVIIECVPAGGRVDLKGTEMAGTPVIAISCRGLLYSRPAFWLTPKRAGHESAMTCHSLGQRALPS